MGPALGDVTAEAEPRHHFTTPALDDNDEDELLGGAGERSNGSGKSAAKATKGRRDVAALTTQVNQITATLAQITQKMGIETPVPEGKTPPQKPPNNQQQVPPTLRKVRQILKGLRVKSITVTEAEVQAKLRALPTTPSAAATWLNTSTPSGEKAVDSSKHVLTTQPWGTAKVVKAANIRTTVLDGPAVTACQTIAEYEQVVTWLGSF